MRGQDDSVQTHFENTCGIALLCCPLLVSDPDAAATAFQCLEGDVEGDRFYRRGRRTRLLVRAAASQHTHMSLHVAQASLTHFLFLQQPIGNDDIRRPLINFGRPRV